ncbi:MAG: uroporphyrinogen decarboxylase [Bacteroidales bacterium]|nr:uroporphyrinogen decarboxylase [Bacteroidales bacterium]MCF8336462.1 uroporphyrinogen decarboxylase [Bacteroidales bacterium]
MESLLLDTIHGKPHSRPPVWFMRQAGRVLPSYLALKEKHTFWQMMRDPELASDVTLLPVYDLGVDAAILFSDILVIPYAMGMGLDFTDKGPVFEQPLKNREAADIKLNPDAGKLDYIYKAIDATNSKRPENIPLIGFCGGPLTVLCYMIEGLGTHQAFPNAVKFIYKNKEQTKKLIETITDLSIEYLKQKAAHKIDVFQLFETHAGLVPSELYNELFMPSVKKMARVAGEQKIPFIFFPKGLSTGLKELTPEHCDFVSIDWQIDLAEARKMVHPDIGLQGNLDPRLLFADQKSIQRTLEKYLDFGSKHSKWIFNLGHGFMPGIPYENAEFLTNWVKNADWNIQ